MAAERTEFIISARISYSKVTIEQKNREYMLTNVITCLLSTYDYSAYYFLFELAFEMIKNTSTQCKEYRNEGSLKAI